MIAHYGYRDASGEYFIAVDSSKCDGCGKCVEACPGKALEMTTQFLDLEDKTVAGVGEEKHRRLKDVCSACARGRSACEPACPFGAITMTYRTGPGASE